MTASVGMLLIVGFWSEAPAQLPGFTQPFNPNTNKIRVHPIQNQELFHKSDAVSIQTSDGSSIRVFNLRGTTVYQGPPGTLPSLPVDHYFVECPGDRTQFCVLPDDYQGASFLGVDADGGTDSAYAQRLAQIQPAWVRIMAHSLWSTVEPLPGIWDWESLDKAVAANQGRKIILAAFFRPGWLKESDQFLPHFLRYVTALAQRYDGRIYAIQIWNEPWVETVAANGMAWGDVGNPVTENMAVDIPVWEQTLATLIAASSQAIRNVSPSIKVFGPDWSNPFYGETTRNLMSLGVRSALDVCTFHADTPVPPDGPISTNGSGFADTVRIIQSYVDPLPVIVSEFHVDGASALGTPHQEIADPGLPSSGLNYIAGMNRLIKSVVMWRANGVEAVLEHVMPMYGTGANANYEIYGWDYASNGGWPRGPHPKTSAYLITGYWLNHATFVDSRTPGQQVYLYGWRRSNNSSLVIAWTTEGQTAPLQSSLPFSVTDIYGKTVQIAGLTETPVLFTSSTLSPSVLMSNILMALTQDYSVPPVWQQPINNQSVRVGQTLQFTVSAFDPNRAPIAYTVSPLPGGASMNPLTGIFTWTPNGAQVGSYNITVTATDDQGKSAATETTIDVVGDLFDGLANYWKFDEGAGSTAGDSSGQASGTFANFGSTWNSGWVSGLVGNALSFNGTSSFVSLPSDELNFTNNFTVSAWLYPRDAAGAGTFIAVRCDYPQSGFRFFVVENSLRVDGFTLTGGKAATFGDGSLLNNNWYHVAVVYDKSTIKAYINGIYQGSAYWGGDLVMDAKAASRIGTENSYFFNGIIDEMLIFNRTLSSQEVSQLFQLVNGSPATPPTLAPIGAKAVRAGQVLAFKISATDVNGAPLAYSATPLPEGAAFNSTNGLFMWTPQIGQVGVRSLTFAASNNQLSDSETVAITVTKSNSPPVLKIIKPKRVRAGRRIRLTLKAKDGNRDPLIYSVDPLPLGATFDPIRRRFEWAPTVDQIGQYNFTASATDGYATSVQLMSITVY